MKLFVTFCLCLMLATSTNAATSNTKDSLILVTLPPLSGLVTWLDPTLNVQCLLPNNADPHHFQLTPKQVDSLQHTSLLIRSPRDDKFWPYFKTDAPILSLWDMQKHMHDEPSHTWLNPQEVLKELPKLANQLIQLHPEHQASIQNQLKTAQLEATKVWQAWQTWVQSTKLTQRGIMMQHPSWQSLFEALGVPIRHILESAQHGQEFGPRKLEAAISVLKQHPNTLLIGDTNHSNRALQWLEKYSATPIIKLDALGQCGEPWLSLMQRNLNTLKQLSVKQ